MNEELDKKLCEDFPLIFRDRHGNMRETCMCWGFAHDDGWYDLIRTLCSTIQSHINSNEERIKNTIEYNAKVNDEDFIWPWSWERKERPVPEPIEQVVAVQVKEKFGGLRFYYSGGDDYIRGVVDMAENMSYKICEDCGSPGKTRNMSGWIKTLCTKHHQERCKHYVVEKCYDDNPLFGNIYDGTYCKDCRKEL